MNSDNTFRTKTGFCHILADRIVLTRDGFPGKVAAVTVGDNTSRILIFYAVLALGLLYFAYDSFQNDQMVAAVVFGSVGLYLSYAVISSLNLSATPVILRADITKVKFKKGLPGFIRPRFEVRFRNESGKIRKRLIILPGIRDGGKHESEKALKLFEDRKY